MKGVLVVMDVSPGNIKIWIMSSAFAQETHSDGFLLGENRRIVGEYNSNEDAAERLRSAIQIAKDNAIDITDYKTPTDYVVWRASTPAGSPNLHYLEYTHCSNRSIQSYQNVGWQVAAVIKATPKRAFKKSALQVELEKLQQFFS